jgi:hypothetical protein
MVKREVSVLAGLSLTGSKQHTSKNVLRARKGKQGDTRK